MNQNRVVISTIVNANIEAVWKAWVTPADIMNWNAASDDWHTPSAVNDLRVGGTFVSTMAARDGSVSFDFTGTYDQIVTGERIDYTIADGRKVTVLFTILPEGVQVVEEFEAESVHPRELQQQGWQSILDRFKRYVEQT